MIWQLVKRDPAWRNALICTAAGVFCPLLPHLFIGWSGWLTGMFWMQSQPQRRASLFQAGLPILAKDLFLARLFAFFALIWLPAGCGAIALLVAGGRANDAATLIEIAGGLSVLVLVALSSRVGEIQGSHWVTAISVGTLWGVAYPTAHFLPPASVLAICAVTCAILFWNIWRQLPASLQVLSGGQTRTVAVHGSTTRQPTLLWLPVLRVLFAPRMLGFLPMVLMGGLGEQLPYISMFCVLPVAAAVSAMPWLLSLPLRRSGLMAVIVAPSIGVMLMGMVFASWRRFDPTIPMEWSGAKRVPNVRPTLEFWRSGDGGMIVSPWGESCPPETTSVLGVKLYNPYTVGPGTSQQFSEWQFRRAAEAFYGHPIDYFDYNHKRVTDRPLVRQPRMVILNLAAYTGWVMLLMNSLFLSLHWRIWRISRYGQHVMSGVLLVQMLGIILFDMSSKHLHAAASVVNFLLLRASQALPDNLPALTVAALLPVALLCWTATRLFDGVEAPPPPSRLA